MVPPSTCAWTNTPAIGSSNRYVLREQGITLVGPPSADLIDPVDPDDLRRAMIAYMHHEWWQSLLADPAQMHASDYQRYVVLILCRVLCTLEHGAVASKPATAQWAAGAPALCWRGTIERAQQAPSILRTSDIGTTHALLRFTLGRARDM